MKSRVLFACLAAAVSSNAAAAGEIFKCVHAGSTSYQSTPCARAQDAVPFKTYTAIAIAREPREATSSLSVARSGRRGPWTHTSIALGMSDDEVLNMPGWGRPARISRARLAGGWEEVWRYGDSYSGERELRFLNARLAQIADTPAAQASVLPR
jgi:Domain of unknown function (DUF4124)